MPIFTIQADDGRKVDIEADTEDAAQETFDEWLTENPPPKSVQSSAGALGRGAIEALKAPLVIPASLAGGVYQTLRHPMTPALAAAKGLSAPTLALTKPPDAPAFQERPTWPGSVWKMPAEEAATPPDPWAKERPTGILDAVLRAAQGAYETTGIPNVAREAGKTAESLAGPAPESRSVVANLLGNLPATTSQIAAEAIPQIAGLKLPASLIGMSSKAVNLVTKSPIAKMIDELPAYGAVARNYEATLGIKPANVGQPGLPALQEQLDALKGRVASKGPSGAYPPRSEMASLEEKAPFVYKDEPLKPDVADVVSSVETKPLPAKRTYAPVAEAPAPPKVDTPEGIVKASDVVDDLAKNDLANDLGRFRQMAGLPLHQKDFKKWRVLDPLVAPPIQIIPEVVESVGKTFDTMLETRQAYYNAVRSISKELTPGDKRWVAMALDSELGVGLFSHLAPVNRLKLTRAYDNTRAVLNKLADLEGLPQNLRLKDYFPHILEQEALARFKKTGEILMPEEGLLVKPTVNPFHKERLGIEGMSYDLDAALNARISLGVRKAYLNPIVAHYQEIAGKLKDPQIAKYLQFYLDKVQGRPLKFEKIVSEALSNMTGGAVSQVKALQLMQRSSAAINRAYYRSLLGLALDTATKNLFQIQNIVIETGFKNTIKGALALATPRGIKAFRDSKIMAPYQNIMEAQQAFFSRSGMSRMIDKILLSPMQATEWINRGIAYNSGLFAAAEKRLKGDLAARYAKLLNERTNFRYGVINTSPYLNNPLGKMFYQFSTYPTNQLAFWRRVLTEKGSIRVGPIYMPANIVKATRLLMIQGFMAGAATAGGMKISDTLGMASAKDLGIPGLKNVPVVGKLPIPLAGTVKQMYQHATTYPAPALQAAMAVASGDKKKAIESLKNLAAGSARIPLRTINKALDLIRESKTGVAKSKQGKFAYPITKGQSVQKFLGLQPEPQQKYAEKYRR